MNKPARFLKPPCPKTSPASSGFYGEDYTPPFCPNPACAWHALAKPDRPTAYRFSLSGIYRTKPHPEGIQRFRCSCCRKTFSRTSFDLEFREKRKQDTLNATIFEIHNMGVSHREVGRKLGLHESLVRARLKKTAQQGMLQHARILGEAKLQEAIVYDGLENFAGSQYDPNQIQHAVGKDSLYIYDCNFIPLNRKGKMSPRQRRINAKIKEEQGKYLPSAIRRASAEIFRRLLERSQPGEQLHLYMDRHFQYRRALNEDLREERSRFQVTTISSKDARTFQNQLFAVNHTDLKIRQRSAAFTRETISFSKTHLSMIEKYMLYMLEKNYQHPQFVKRHKRRPLAHVQSPAMAAGLTEKRLSFGELFLHRLSPRQVKLNREWQAYYDGIVPYTREKQAVG